MKRKIIVIGSIFMITISVYAISKNFTFNLNTLSFNKEKVIMDNFNKDYTLTYTISNLDKKLETEITNLTKKTTNLLLGEMGSKEETSEHYYKRHEDFLNLTYLPDIPKSGKSETGYDENSQEYKDYLISSMTLPKVFLSLTEHDIVYNSYGDIRITQNNDIIISSITIPNIKMKEASTTNPKEYEYIETNLIIYYYFKEVNDEYKLYYLYTELEDNLNLYFEKVSSSEKLNALAIIPPYENNLEIYDYSKLKNISDATINDIYSNNKDKVVYLTANYNNTIVKMANGFLIGDGIVVTTWDFLENALINGQDIILTTDSKTLKIDGIVTIKPELNVVVLKLTEKTNTYVKIGSTKNIKVNAVGINLSTATGVGLTSNAGIILANSNYLETSIPIPKDISGSPLFNINGEVIGMNLDNNTNTSISRFLKGEALKEIQEKFTNIDFAKIESISFQDLKEKYYYVNYNEEVVKNNIPSQKWKEYSKIGNIEKNINLELIKASYKDGIISLRYNNSIKNYVNSMDLIAPFKEELVKSGFKNTLNTNSKVIYENQKYRVIIMEEFDYLIVIEVKL